jgi:hypothetical protein
MLRSFKTQNYDLLKSFVRKNINKKRLIPMGNERLPFGGYDCHQSPSEKTKKVRASLE